MTCQSMVVKHQRVAGNRRDALETPKNDSIKTLRYADRLGPQLCKQPILFFQVGKQAIGQVDVLFGFIVQNQV